MGDFVKKKLFFKVVNIGMHSDVCEVILFGFGMLTDLTKLCRHTPN